MPTATSSARLRAGETELLVSVKCHLSCRGGVLGFGVVQGVKGLGFLGVQGLGGFWFGGLCKKDQVRDLRLAFDRESLTAVSSGT